MPRKRNRDKYSIGAIQPFRNENYSDALQEGMRRFEAEAMQLSEHCVQCKAISDEQLTSLSVLFCGIDDGSRKAKARRERFERDGTLAKDGRILRWAWHVLATRKSFMNDVVINILQDAYRKHIEPVRAQERELSAAKKLDLREERARARREGREVELAAAAQLAHERRVAKVAATLAARRERRRLRAIEKRQERDRADPEGVAARMAAKVARARHAASVRLAKAAAARAELAEAKSTFQDWLGRQGTAAPVTKEFPPFKPK